MTDPRYVVTGAAGFIGSCFLEALTKRIAANELLAVDHPLTPGKQANRRATANVQFCDHHRFLAALEAGDITPTIIYHLGACSSTTESSWAYLSENNLGYSQRLWNWCAVARSRLIYASSAATYGDGSHGFDDEDDLRVLRPLNLYGKSKHDFDVWVNEQTTLGRPRPSQCVGLKFFNVFGPGEAHKGRMASMVFHGWHQILQRGSVRLFKSHKEGYTDGGQLRDFIYVQDVVKVMNLFADRPEISGLFNLGTGHARSFNELIGALFAACGRESRIEYIPMPEDLQSNYQYFTEAKMAKLARAGVPYTPTSLEDAIVDYVRRLNAELRLAPGASPSNHD